ncbi:sso2 [Hyphodiscus hymeniophilus]|uniref:Sso2 n=1 Tax=Hyphodiscus hymeniophilus TaxID=353542 RepID=A0A9P6SPP3_9HELO|nr:sso2 [Hyphodiscus hymeniophilus]
MLLTRINYRPGGRSNPFDDRGAATQGGYGGQPYGGRQQYNAQAMGRDEYAGTASRALHNEADSYTPMGRTDSHPGHNVEMEPLTAGLNRPSHSQERGDPNAILNDLRQIDQGVASIYQSLENVKKLQQSSLNDPDSSNNTLTNQKLDDITSETMAMYRNLAGRIKAIKQKPESGSPRNAPQLGKVDRQLKDAIEAYRIIDRDYRNKLRDQMARQYRIVRPEATEAEVREAVEDKDNQQVFSQALLHSDRRGQSRSALSAVQNRHEAIQKIEQQMIELSELFADMDRLVVQQEAAVVNIEMKGEEVVENMDKGTQEIGVAIKSARNARKWKWWCLGICVLIVIIIVIVILIYKFVIQNNNSGGKRKRFVLPTVDMPALNSARVVPGQPWTPSEKLVVPGLEWSHDNTLTTKSDAPGTQLAAPLSGRWVKFAG